LPIFASLSLENFGLDGYPRMAVRRKRMEVSELYYLGRALEWLVQLYEAWGKPEKAAEWRRR